MVLPRHLDTDKSKEILENYFANVTQEQFAIDLEKYCPELVESERDNIDDSCLIVHPILVRGSRAFARAYGRLTPRAIVALEEN
jgi:hypothetical protein